MPDARSAIRSAQKAVVSALKANPILLGILATDSGIASGKGPQKPSYPNIRLNDVREGDYLTFDKMGKLVRFSGDIWSARVADNDQVAEIYEQMELSLNRVQLPIEGQTHLLGTLECISILLDPSGTLTHGRWRYEGYFQNA